MLVAALTAGIGYSSAHAQSRVFIQNDTEFDLVVTDVSTSGGRLSKKAWKTDAQAIARGERKSVLKINRAGKFNWMDPTPRFIEPGKTIIFTTVIAPDGGSNIAPLQLRQKLLGTGESSDMWHSIDGTDEKHDWYNDDADYQAVWKPNDTDSIDVQYRIVEEDGDTHVEYVLEDSSR